MLQHTCALLQADDRLLLITEGAQPSTSGKGLQPSRRVAQAADLRVVHLRLPAAYLAASWPLMHAATSADGMDIAVAGRHGLALYSRRSGKWRLFGDVSQEREINVHVSQLPSLALIYLAFCAVCVLSPYPLPLEWSFFMACGPSSSDAAK